MIQLLFNTYTSVKPVKSLTIFQMKQLGSEYNFLFPISYVLLPSNEYKTSTPVEPVRSVTFFSNETGY